MRKYKYAGISTVHTDSGKERHFNATTIRGRVGVWLNVPGKVDYSFVTLPQEMTKLEAARYLKEHEDFQTKGDQDYLEGVIAKREADEAKKATKGTRGRKKKAKVAKDPFLVEMVPVAEFDVPETV